MGFRLNPASGLPAYLQIVRQVEHALRTGLLRMGDQLPTVKQVISEIAINPNTVAKAYRELEMAGWVRGRQGVGTFVVRCPCGPPPATYARLAHTLEAWVASARREGLDDAAMEALLRGAIDDQNAGVA